MPTKPRPYSPQTTAYRRPNHARPNRPACPTGLTAPSTRPVARIRVSVPRTHVYPGGADTDRPAETRTQKHGLTRSNTDLHGVNGVVSYHDRRLFADQTAPAPSLPLHQMLDISVSIADGFRLERGKPSKSFFLCGRFGMWKNKFYSAMLCKYT